MMPNDPNFAPPAPVIIRPLSSNGLFNVSSGAIHVSYFCFDSKSFSDTKYEDNRDPEFHVKSKWRRRMVHDW